MIAQFGVHVWYHDMGVRVLMLDDLFGRIRYTVCLHCNCAGTCGREVYVHVLVLIYCNTAICKLLSEKLGVVVSFFHATRH